MRRQPRTVCDRASNSPERLWFAAPLVLVTISSLVYLAGCDTGQQRRPARPIKRVAIVSFGSTGEDCSDLYVGKVRKFADVTSEVASTMFIYRPAIRSHSASWFKKLLPALLEASVKHIQASGKVDLLPAERVGSNPLYQSIGSECAIRGALSAHPSLAFLDEKCAAPKLAKLQEELQADALVTLDSDLTIDSLSMTFHPVLHGYQDGIRLLDSSSVDDSSSVGFQDRSPFKSRDSFIDSLSEVFTAAVPGARASGEQAEQMCAYLEKKLPALAEESGKKTAEKLLQLTEASASK